MYYHHIIKNFNRAARDYDNIATIQKQTAIYLVNFLRANTHTKPSKILDVGTGTGFVVDGLLKHFPLAHYVLNDISPIMFELARKKFAANDNIAFHLGNVEETVFTTQDLIISNLAFQWFKNFENTLANLWDKTNVLVFATLIDKTFSTWEMLHQNLGLICNMHHYPTAADMQACCLQLRPQQYFFTMQTYQMDFANPLAFARYLKKLGANTLHADGYDNLRGNNLLSILQSPAANKQFTTNYEVLFAVLVK